MTHDKRQLLAFARRLIRLRREHPVFRRRRFFQGRPIHGSDIKDIMWLKPDGAEMSEEEWQHDHARCLGVLLSGEGMSELDQRGRRVSDGTFLLLFNAHHEELAFHLPSRDTGIRWLVMMDTTHQDGLVRNGAFDAGEAYPLKGRSLALLQQQSL